MKKVFISRDLKEGSAFRQILEPSAWEVYDESLIQFEALAFEYDLESDWIFFYSRNAVHFFFEGAVKGMPAGVQLGCMGESTAQALPRSADFIGNGEAAATAAAFLAKAKGQKVVFPRAKNSKKSIQLLLEGQIDVEDVVVYENKPKAEFSVPDVDVLVFTSPLNAQTYFQKYRRISDQKVVAIGQTTAAALRQMGIHEISIASKPYEEYLAKVVCNF